MENGSKTVRTFAQKPEKDNARKVNRGWTLHELQPTRNLLNQQILRSRVDFPNGFSIGQARCISPAPLRKGFTVCYSAGNQKTYGHILQIEQRWTCHFRPFYREPARRRALQRQKEDQSTATAAAGIGRIAGKSRRNGSARGTEISPVASGYLRGLRARPEHCDQETPPSAR